MTQYMTSVHPSEMDGHPRPCFFLVPGFGPDVLPVRLLGERLEGLGFPVVVSNFWGDMPVGDFAALSMEECATGIAAGLARTRVEHPRVVGIGISLGGALLMECAKTGSHLDYIVSIGTPLKLRNRWLFSGIVWSYPVLAPVWRTLAKIRSLRIPPMEAAGAVMRFLEGGFLRDLHTIRTPLLLLHSRRDFITQYSAAMEFAEHFPSRNLILFEDGDHVLDYNIERIIQTILAHVPYR